MVTGRTIGFSTAMPKPASGMTASLPAPRPPETPMNTSSLSSAVGGRFSLGRSTTGWSLAAGELAADQGQLVR